MTVQSQVSLATQSSLRQDRRPGRRPCARPFARGPVQTCKQSRHLVLNQSITSIRRLGNYVRRDGDHVIASDDKRAAVDSPQGRDDLGNERRKEPQKIVFPLNTFDARLGVADDVRATSYDVGAAWC